jgi:hypothetical protein
VSNLKQIFLKFCNSVGHDKKNCRSYDLMIEHCDGAYRMKVEACAQEDQGQHAE